MKGNDLDAFRVLDKIVSEGSFSKAAAALHKTVPAISYSIAQLEARYGLNMVDRSGYRVTLTPCGVRMLEEARKVINQADYLSSVATQLTDHWEPKLEVIIDGMLEPSIILQVIDYVQSKNAPTIFQLTPEYLGGVERRFDIDNADIMFSLNYPHDNRWLSEHLFDIETMLVASPSSNLDKNKRYRLSDLSAVREVSVQDSSHQQPEPGRSLGSSELFFVGDFYTKKQAILSGMGIGWMPLSWVTEEINNGKLFEVNYSGGSRDQYQVCVGTWKNRHPGRAQSYFIESIKQHFES